MVKPAASGDGQPTEQQVVVFRRFNEARDAGLNAEEALAFAESDGDIGQLRKLVAGHCPTRLIVNILN